MYALWRAGIAGNPAEDEIVAHSGGNAKLIWQRSVIAIVWLYHGLWCKLLSASPTQIAVVASVPLAGHAAEIVLPPVGAVETLLAIWVLAGRGARPCEIVQTVLLIGMNR